MEIGKRLEIQTPDGKRYVGKVMGKNLRQDYSLVKIEARLGPYP